MALGPTYYATNQPTSGPVPQRQRYRPVQPTPAGVAPAAPPTSSIRAPEPNGPVYRPPTSPTSPPLPPPGPIAPPAPPPMLPPPGTPAAPPPPGYTPPPVDINTPAAGRIGDDYGPDAGTIDANETRYRELYGAGPQAESARSARYGTAQDDALASLTGGPNRTELARQTLADFDREGEIGLQNRFRRVGQAAAKFGQIGLGNVNAELGSIQGDYERNRLQKQNELAASVAEGDIGDRYRTVGAVQGLRGQESALDRARSNDTLERSLAATDAARGVRGEQRTERAYQQGEAQRTIENRLAQRRAEDEAEQLRIRRALAMQGAGDYGAQAAWGG